MRCVFSIGFSGDRKLSLFQDAANFISNAVLLYYFLASLDFGEVHFGKIGGGSLAITKEVSGNIWGHTLP